MAAQQLCNRSKPLGKDEFKFMPELIVKHKIITTKATNATNNKLKEEAWKSIADELSALAGEIRRPEQIRLKWENLKKAARKRQANMRQNNMKVGSSILYGGGKSYIRPDEALDRVASILGATCNDYTVEYGGDTEMSVPVIEIIDSGILPESQLLGDNIAQNEVDEFVPCTLKTFVFNRPKKTLTKRQKLSEDLLRARIKKEMAIASYFKSKTEKQNLENLKLKLEIENLKNKLN